jgi:hypothetical protein
MKKIGQANRLDVAPQMVSIFEVALCLSISQSGRQNGENQVWGGYGPDPAYPKRTQGYASVDCRIWTVDRH